MSDVRQLTEQEAIAFFNSDEWKAWDHEQIVKLQLFQDRLCIPFDRFHEAVEAVLGRPVWTHEFAFQDGLIQEYFGTKPTATIQEIIDLIPKTKQIVILLGKEGDAAL